MAKKFSQAFWVANSVELLERLAYYAVFVVLTIYLSNVWGFSDGEAGIISGVFSALLYLLPTFEGASPAWYANVNPLIVFIFVNIVTSFMRKRKAIHSMIIGMFIIPVSALIMASGNLIQSETVSGMHPIAFMMIVGIAFQAIAECFISPRYLNVTNINYKYCIFRPPALSQFRVRAIHKSVSNLS